LYIEQSKRSVQASINENHHQILLYRLEKSALEEHSINLDKLTCLARPKFWPKKTRQLAGSDDMESNRDSSKQQRGKGSRVVLVQVVNHIHSKTTEDIFMDVTLCRYVICIYLMKGIQKDTRVPDVDTSHSYYNTLYIWV
jgi:hypothetical protein